MNLRLQTGVRRALGRARVARATSVLIVADTHLYRDGLAMVLARRKDIRMVGAGIDPEEVVERVRASAPDVVLFAIGDNSLGWIEELFDAAPGAKVIVLGFRETEADVLAYARAGVSGFMTRESSLDELVACIRSVDHDEFVCSPQVAAILLESAVSATSSNGSGSRCSTLTARQLEILQLVDSGLSNKEIAQRLYIELSTVKNHVHQILEKLEVRSRREAAAALRSRSNEI